MGYRAQDGMYLERDRLFAIAYQMFEDSLCRGCGLPHSVTHGDHNVGRFEWHDDSICHGCESKAELSSDKNRATYPGQEVYPVDTHA